MAIFVVSIEPHSDDGSPVAVATVRVDDGPARPRVVDVTVGSGPWAELSHVRRALAGLAEARRRRGAAAHAASPGPRATVHALSVPASRRRGRRRA